MELFDIGLKEEFKHEINFFVVFWIPKNKPLLSIA